MKYCIIENIPKNPKKILDYAKSKCFDFLVDEKDTKDNPSFARGKSKLSYEEAFEHIQANKPHWVFSFRNISYLSATEEDFWEFGGCNIASNDYGSVFIWIKVHVEEAEKIIKKFKLIKKHY